MPPIEAAGATEPLEKYWFCCMQLASALASRTDATPFVAMAEAAFAKLDRDSCVTDWLSVDGDGRAP